MKYDRADRIRGVVMFVIAWLIGLYVYEVVQDAFRGPIGIVAAAITVGVNLYARKKASGCVERNFMFRFWLYLPVVLFIVLPVAVKVIAYLTTEVDQSWWSQLTSLLPFVLKLGVPVAILLWVYWAVGRLNTEERNTGADL